MLVCVQHRPQEVTACEPVVGVGGREEGISDGPSVDLQEGAGIGVRNSRPAESLSNWSRRRVGRDSAASPAPLSQNKQEFSGLW